MFLAAKWRNVYDKTNFIEKQLSMFNKGSCMFTEICHGVVSHWLRYHNSKRQIILLSLFIGF